MTSDPDHGTDIIGLNDADFIDFDFIDPGHYHDASMGITDPTLELEPFKPIPLIELDGPQGLRSEPGSSSK